MTRRLAFPVLALVVFISMSFAGVSGATWSPQLAAHYLDARQKAWFEWKPAVSADGPCVSCHTGMTYLLARPALRRVLGEPQETMYERGLMDRLRANVGAKRPSALQEVEVIFAAFFLTEQNARNPVDQTLHDDSRKAFDQLWQLQQQTGPNQGAWRWYQANLDPWENPDSSFYGASIAAHAVGTMPPGYRNDAVSERTAALVSFLQGSPTSMRSLHDRLAALWASSRLPDVISEAARGSILAEVFNKQAADGGWTIASLGPWASHVDAPSAPGSDGYATAFVAFVLGRAGVPSSHAGVSRALDWLQAHQDANTGAWPARSMNKRYPPDSMPALFMQDAATAFAALALVEANR